MNALVEQPTRSRSMAIDDVVDIMDTGRFDQMARIASVMARSSLIPDSLAGVYVGTGQNRKFEAFPPEVVQANCFLIVNQSVRWGLDPFAVAQSTSVVRGKLCYEGKLVAGVISAKLGIDLDYDFNDKGGDDLEVTVTGVVGGRSKVVKGTVKEWKTTGDGSPWGKGNESNKRMLRYRGAREWARAYTPALMLGVYTQDEMLDAADRARDITPPPPPAGIEQQTIAPKEEKKVGPRTDAAYADMGRTEERQEDPPPPPTEQKKEQPAAPARTAAPEEKKDPPPPPPGPKAPKGDDGRDYEGLLDAFETTMGEATTLEEVEDLKQRAMGSWAEAAPEDIFEKAKRVYVAARKRVTTTKPADQPPADDPPPPPAGDAGPPADPEKATAPVIPKMEDLEGWYQRGYDDFVAGLAFNKYPPVLKEDGYLEAKQSWMDGYSTAKKKAPKKD